MLCSVFTGRSVKTMEFSFGSPFDPSCFAFCISQLPKMLAEMDPFSSSPSVHSGEQPQKAKLNLRKQMRAAAKSA